MDYIRESIQTKVERHYDVAVCGGGFAGIAAALAGARHGAKTVLFERQFMLGGLGTAGLITIYLPLCDGMGRQVSFGLAEELLRESIVDGAEAKYPANWLDGVGTRTREDDRFQVRFNAQLFAMRAEQMLLDAGVDVFYGTYVVGTDKEGDKIRHLVTENKSGRLAWAVGSVVDATGDADVAFFSGAPTQVYERGNNLAGWYYAAGKEGLRLCAVGVRDDPDYDPRDTNKLLFRGKPILGVDGEELSFYTHASRTMTYADFLKRRQEDPSIFPVTISTIPQLRMTRRLCGAYEMDEGERHTRFEDSIGMVSNWKKRGPVYEVPLRTLYSDKVKNLIMAGRCTSVTDSMWDVMRVIPCCSVTGQAAGTAAAMSDDFSALDVSALQRTLEQDGVVLHESDLPERREL